MTMKYQLTVDELIRFFCGDKPKGNREEALKAAEERLGVGLPERYRRYLLLCGEEEVNDIFNHANKPEEIGTSYEMLRLEMEDRAEEFEEAKQEQSAEYADDDYFKLYGLPEERWPEMTQEYVLTWYENQGVWNGGYLLSDLKEGKPDPAVYMSTDDDFISFAPLYTNTEAFLLEMLRQAAWEYGSRIVKREEILFRLAESGVDFSQLQVGYPDQMINCSCQSGTCLDTEKNILYFYFETGDYAELQIVEGKH